MENSVNTPENKEAVGYLATAVNIFTAPRDAFNTLEQRPSKLFPLAVMIVSTMLVMFWYFSIVDFEWYVDDVLTGSNLEGEQLEQARENMLQLSRTNMMLFGMLGGAVGMLVIFVLQSAYLSLVSALHGDKYRFGHWFSAVCWTGLPSLLAIVGMVVTILLSPNGQLSAYDLNPLTLTNLGMQTDNASLQSILNSLNLPMVWSLALMVMLYRQWLNASALRATVIVTAPYILIFGIWTYFALR